MSLNKWKIEAKCNAIDDYEIQSIINCYIDPRIKKVIGKSFQYPEEASAFSDVNNRVIYIPVLWKENFPYGELEWVVLHELIHVVNNHQGIDPRNDEPIADSGAAILQGTKQHGIRILRKLSSGNLNAYSSEIIGRGPPSLTYRERIGLLSQLDLP